MLHIRVSESSDSSDSDTSWISGGKPDDVEDDVEDDVDGGQAELAKQLNNGRDRPLDVDVALRLGLPAVGCNGPLALVAVALPPFPRAKNTFQEKTSWCSSGIQWLFSRFLEGYGHLITSSSNAF